MSIIPCRSVKLLVRPLLDRRLEGGAREDDRSRSGDHPPDMVCVPFP